LAVTENDASVVCEASPYNDCVIERAPLLVCECGDANADQVVAWAREARQLEFVPSLLPTSSTKPQCYACIVGSNEQLRSLLAMPSGDDGTWRWRTANVAVVAPSPDVQRGAAQRLLQLQSPMTPLRRTPLTTPQAPLRHTITVVHDTASCFVPPHVGGRDIDGAELYKLIVDAIIDACQLDSVRPRIVWRFVCNDYASVGATAVRPTTALLHALVARGVTRVGTSPHKSAVDGVVRQLIDEHVHTFARLSAAAQESETFVLISGDSDVAVDLQRVVDVGVPRILLLNDAASCSAALRAVAPNERGDWYELVERAAVRPSTPQHSLANGHTSTPTPTPTPPVRSSTPAKERILLSANQLAFIERTQLLLQWRLQLPAGVSVELAKALNGVRTHKHAGAVDVLAEGESDTRIAVVKVAALINGDVSSIVAVPVILYGVDSAALLADESAPLAVACRDARAVVVDSALPCIDVSLPVAWDRAALVAHLTRCGVPFADVRLRRATAAPHIVAQITLDARTPTEPGALALFADIIKWQAASDAIVGTAPATRLRFSFDTPARKLAILHQPRAGAGEHSAPLHVITTLLESAQRRTASLDFAAMLAGADSQRCVVIAGVLLTAGADWLLHLLAGTLAAEKVGIALHPTLHLVQLEGAPAAVARMLPPVEAALRAVDARIVDGDAKLLELQQWAKQYDGAVRAFVDAHDTRSLLIAHSGAATATFALNALVSPVTPVAQNGRRTSTTTPPMAAPAHQKTFFYRCHDDDLCQWLRLVANEAAYEELVRRIQASFGELSVRADGVSVSKWTDRRHPESILRVSGEAGVVGSAVGVITRSLEPLRASLHLRRTPVQATDSVGTIDDVRARSAVDGAVVCAASTMSAVHFYGTQEQIEKAMAKLEKKSSQL
jgi:hypothetical protein